MDGILQNKAVLIAVGVLFALYFIGLFLYVSMRKKKNALFEEENPTVNKVYIQNGMRVKSTNGTKLRMFSKGMKQGFYLFTGEHKLNVSYTYSKGRRTTVSVKPVDLTLTVDTAKEYLLEYDDKKNIYDFIEK